MSDAEGSLRLRLVLGKFQVTRISGGIAYINLGTGVTMHIEIPPGADLRLGDWLTYYTECPYAQPIIAPKQ